MNSYSLQVLIRGIGSATRSACALDSQHCGSELDFAWGFDYHFTNQKFKQQLQFQKTTFNVTPLARYLFNKSQLF